MSIDTLCNEIIEKYYASIYRYCLVRLNHNEFAADDCTQEVFLILLQKQSKLNLSDNIRAWLYETANRVIKAYMRKINKEEKIANPDEILDDTVIILGFGLTSYVCNTTLSFCLLGGRMMYILKEDNQFTATYQKNNIVYLITAIDCSYDECNKVIESLVE